MNKDGSNELGICSECGASQFLSYGTCNYNGVCAGKVIRPKTTKILHLTLKKRWYDLIKSGVKVEEYREIKMYWWKRLVECGECYRSIDDSLNAKLAAVNEWKMLKGIDFEAICFKNGYSKTAPSFLIEFKGIEIGKAKPEWSDNWQGDVFIINLGNIINS